MFKLRPCRMGIQARLIKSLNDVSLWAPLSIANSPRGVCPLQFDPWTKRRTSLRQAVRSEKWRQQRTTVEGDSSCHPCRVAWVAYHCNFLYSGLSQLTDNSAHLTHFSIFEREILCGKDDVSSNGQSFPAELHCSFASAIFFVVYGHVSPYSFDIVLVFLSSLK